MILSQPNSLPEFPLLRAHIPPELKLREQWVVWRRERRKGKDTKVPYNPRTDKLADTTNPQTWVLFIEALEAYESGRYDGIGFVFAEEDPYTGIDYDHVRDPKTGAVAEWATEWVEAFDGYAEISPSETGIHVIVRGLAPGRKNQKAGVEAYSSKRFFSFTGNVVTDIRQIPERQDVIDRFCAKFFPVKPTREPTEERAAQPIDLEDQELLDKARSASRGVGERFTALYDRGDFLEHASHSEARHELLKLLAFWTGWDPERMSRLYEGSALYALPGYAEKWARLGVKECHKAIASSPRAYRQEARPSKTDGGELARIIQACRAMAAAMAWDGRGGPTDRSVYDGLLDHAATYGTIAKRGIIFSVDLRTLALKVGISRLETVRNALRRLREERRLIRLSKKGTGKRAAVYLLRYPNVPQKRYTKPCVDYVPLLRELRNPGATTEKECDKNGRKLSHDTRFLLRRLGKPVALPIEHISNSPGITFAELARELRRRPDNVRRTLVRALGAGLVAEEGGRLYVPDDLRWRLEVELDQSGCNKARQRDAERFDDERRAFYSRHERQADPAPSEEDLARQLLQRVQDALDILQDVGTGPAQILEDYVSGKTARFDYVVNAVAFYYGCASPEAWYHPVERAVELIAGLPSRGSA